MKKTKERKKERNEHINTSVDLKQDGATNPNASHV